MIKSIRADLISVSSPRSTQLPALVDVVEFTLICIECALTQITFVRPHRMSQSTCRCTRITIISLTASAHQLRRVITIRRCQSVRSLRAKCYHFPFLGGRQCALIENDSSTRANLSRPRTIGDYVAILQQSVQYSQRNRDAIVVQQVVAIGF